MRLKNIDGKWLLILSASLIAISAYLPLNECIYWIAGVSFLIVSFLWVNFLRKKR